MTETYEVVDTEDGPFTVLADADGAVLASGWTAEIDAIIARIATPPKEIAQGSVAATDAVRAYYDGDLGAIDHVRVRQTGTEWQRRGWAALRQIAPGAPLTYAALADTLGSPRAVRAAAAICARNAPALFVPCHRVLRRDGSMGGFAWGIGVKRSLLARESR